MWKRGRETIKLVASEYNEEVTKVIKRFTNDVRDHTVTAADCIKHMTPIPKANARPLPEN